MAARQMVHDIPELAAIERLSAAGTDLEIVGFLALDSRDGWKRVQAFAI